MSKAEQQTWKTAGSLTNGITSVAVFCGANNGHTGAFLAAACDLGRALVETGFQLVYGGSRAGLMGALANTVLAEGGVVTGVIPRALATSELMHDSLTELITVDTMHARKAEMASRADAFIALPGGFGTLDETFEALTWTQLGIHHKPVGFLNVDGFYDDLISFMDRQVSSGFVRPDHRDMITFGDSAKTLLATLARTRVPKIGKWNL